MASKRELIEPYKGDKRYIRRDEKGRIKESDDVSRSLSQDQKRKAKTLAKPGQGDKGDRAPAKKSSGKKSFTTSAKKAASKKSSTKAPTRKAASSKNASAKKK
jgi:hypothetical protein